MKLLRIFTLFVATSLLATACMRVNLEIAVDAEGNGTIAGTMLYSDKLAAIAAMEEGNDFDFCGEIQSGEADMDPAMDLPDGATVTPVTEDGWCGIAFTADFANFDPSGVGDMDGGGFVVDGDTISFSMDMTDLGSDEDMEMEEVTMMLEMFDIPDPEFTIEVTLPGTVLTHNADSVDGSTLHWDVDLFGEGKTLTASADMSAESSNTKVIIIVVAIAALLAALVARQRSGSALTAPEEAPEADAPTDAAE